jgi:hypothetical protein
MEVYTRELAELQGVIIEKEKLVLEKEVQLKEGMSKFDLIIK